MKIFRLLITAAILAGGSCPAAWAVLAAGGIGALDGAGTVRDTFSNVEAIALRQQVNNSAASSDRIKFKFTIYNPGGGAVFRHDGNSTNAVPGNSNSQIALPISRFYSVPGVYLFRGEATLDSVTVTQETRFSVSSPNINLNYPPCPSALNLTDKPLIFRWRASGASTYEITVEDRKGMVHTGTISTGQYTYPENPSQDKEKLVPDTVYYWRVVGQDNNGLKISESSFCSFSLKSQATSQSRNVAVISLELANDKPAATNTLNFDAIVQNTGGSNEQDLEVKLTLGGVPAQGSPKRIEMLNSGETKKVPFTTLTDEGMAVACVNIFDDNIPDNCKTKLIARDTGAADAAAAADENRKLSYQDIWDEVLKKLGPEAASALDGYTFDSIDCPNCSPGELNEMMLALMNGDAKLTGAAVVETSPGGQAQVLASAGPEITEAEPDDKNDLLSDLMPDKQKQDEWSGYTGTVKSEEPVYYIMKSAKDWEKTWKMFSTEEAPDVDFADKMVVGIVAGSGSRADTVRILSHRRKADVVIFDYYITQSSAETYFVPYIFRVEARADGNVEFQRIDGGGK